MSLTPPSAIVSVSDADFDDEVLAPCPRWSTSGPRGAGRASW